MYNDYNKDFINSIDIGSYINKSNNRKIIIWGAGSIGKKVYEILTDNNLSVYGVIDSNTGVVNSEFCGIKIQTPQILDNEEKFFVIVAMMNYHKEIYEFLKEKNYNELEDFLYLFHKPLVIEKDEEYIDIYGNKIRGKKGDTFNIIAYNSELNLYSKNISDTAKIFCCNSKINLNKECHIKDEVRIYCYNNSELNLEDSEGTIINRNSEILCSYDSKLNIGSLCNFDEKTYIICLNNSELNIDSGCYFKEKVSITCCNSSKLEIGLRCYFGESSILACKENSALNIGYNCTFEKYFTVASYYFGSINIANDIMASLNVSIFNNDTHPIFDINTNTQINRNNTIIIKDHVWLGVKSTVLTGAEIGEGSIVGANSVVTKKFFNNCTIAGIPAKLLRKDIAWDREETDIGLVNKEYFNITKIE